MTAAEFFTAAACLPIGTLADVTGGGGLVVVAPHPDDESLGCGGLIAAARAERVEVRLVVVSDGVGSHPNSRLYPPSRLRALREEETCRAAAELGLDAAAIRFLRLPDRSVPTRGAQAEAASEAIVVAARECAAGAVCVTWRHDPHCDHEASAILVDAARARLGRTRVFAYPVWGWELPPTTEVGGPAGRPPLRHRAPCRGEGGRDRGASLADHGPDRRRSRRLPPRPRDDRPLRRAPRAPARSRARGAASVSRHETSLPAAYFDDLYARDADPWRFASSDYERDKYAATLAALPRAKYCSVLEIGCSIGVLTRQLAARAEALCAVDLAAQALDHAGRRCADLGHVRFELASVPTQWPDGLFDLIVLSEVVYYLDRNDLAALVARVRACLAPGGDIVLVHWLGETHYPMTGDEAVEGFTALTIDWAACLSSTRTDAYRLDVIRAKDADA